MLSDDHHNIHTVQKIERDNNNFNLNKISTNYKQKITREIIGLTTFDFTLKAVVRSSLRHRNAYKVKYN
ncbi:hypothetical protein AYC90_01400 [Salmonella enterica]|nr:hypothetical protein [Salmonella enterica]EAU0237715.1 hypothetical protein [Salmonella enterica]